MRIYPLGNRMLVKQIEENEFSRGGIVMNVSKKKLNRGVVCSVGDAVLEVQEDDEVFFGEYAGSGIEDTDGQEFLIITEDEVLAIIEK